MGAFLLTVQAHTLWVDSAAGEEIDGVGPFGTPDFTNKREGGQLLLLRLPGVWVQTARRRRGRRRAGTTGDLRIPGPVSGSRRRRR